MIKEKSRTQMRDYMREYLKKNAVSVNEQRRQRRTSRKKSVELLDKIIALIVDYAKNK